MAPFYNSGRSDQGSGLFQLFVCPRAAFCSFALVARSMNALFLSLEYFDYRWRWIQEMSSSQQL